MHAVTNTSEEPAALPLSTLKMDVAGSAETSITIYEYITTWCRNP
jgi:hypothetical protein